VFSRMAVTLRNIHFGGALSGNAAIRFSQSMFCILEPRSLPNAASPASTATSTRAFFMPPDHRPARPPTTEQKVPHKRSEASRVWRGRRRRKASRRTIGSTTSRAALPARCCDCSTRPATSDRTRWRCARPSSCKQASHRSSAQGGTAAAHPATPPPHRGSGEASRPGRRGRLPRSRRPSRQGRPRWSSPRRSVSSSASN